MRYHIADQRLAPQGKLKISWAESKMPVLRLIRERFKKQKTLRNRNIGCCLHITTETANLVRTLQAGGARVFLTASNPLSTQDEVAAALALDGIGVFARHGESRKEYYENMNRVIRQSPEVLIDDGADICSEDGVVLVLTGDGKAGVAPLAKTFELAPVVPAPRLLTQIAPQGPLEAELRTGHLVGRLGQGRENAKAFLREHPDTMDEITAKLRENLDLPALISKDEEEE